MKAAPTAGKKVEMKKLLATFAITVAILGLAAAPALACERPPKPTGPAVPCQDFTKVTISAQGQVEINATYACQGRYFEIDTNAGSTPPAFASPGSTHVITLWVAAGQDIQWFLNGHNEYVTVSNGATQYAQEYLS